MPKSKYKRVVLLVFAMVFIFGAMSPIFALDPQKTINQYGHTIWIRQNGLPATAVNVVLQTHDGYIWFGMSAGLFRFDGVSFTQVSTNPENSKSNESVTSLCETRDSSLWIGTGYNGLRRLKNGKMYNYGSKEGFYDTQIRQLVESRTGSLLIGTSNGSYTFKNGVFRPLLLNPNYISGLAEDSLGRIWVGTHLGVRIIDESDPTKVVWLTTKNGLPQNVTTYIYTDRQANVWVGTFAGLARWKDGKFTIYNVNNGLSDNFIYVIFQDKDDNIWVGTRRGLNRFSGGKWTSYINSDGLTDNNVLSLAEDHEGGLWVCTSNGLNLFKNVNITTFTTYEGLPSNYISSIIETSDKSLYFFSNERSYVTRFINGKITKRGTQIGPLFAGPVYSARDGSLWVGQSGLLFNIKNGKVKRYDATTGLPLKWIPAITEDDKSLILYIDHKGIFRFINGRLTPYLMKNGKKYPAEEYVVCFYQQHDNLLWIGAASRLIKVENGEATTYTTKDGLAGNWVTSIYDDRQGNLWISSPQGGLTRYKNGKFTAYSKKAGLFTDEIYCVLGDDQGDLWLSSPVGIGRVSCKELDDYAEGRTNIIHSQVYEIADGMKTDECFGEYQPAGWKTHDGHIWFATRIGAVMIDPKTFKKNELQPPVLIEHVTVDQQIIPPDHFISLPAGTQKLEFHYTALSFLVSSRVLFKYKLEGYDHDWVDAGTRRVAYYTNLPHGDYRFRVMACNNDGLWNEVCADFGFKLEPHFYEMYWFYALILIVLGGIIYGFIRLRLWQHIKKEKELQDRIQEALANLKILGGLVPICANCKKIRDDKGYWDQLEEYVQTHSDVRFSHSICPECAKELYPDMILKKKKT
ncbi:MAG: two-component regulator propeller domain-containing protein [Bacteroidota bacterium]